jgi:hypothetical protein
VHDEMLTLFDDCIERMLQLRAHLSASRRVHPGERHATVVSAIEVAARFASEATRTVSPPAGPTQPVASLAASPDSVRPFPAVLPAVASPASPDLVRPCPAALPPLPAEPAPLAARLTAVPGRHTTLAPAP